MTLPGRALRWLGWGVPIISGELDDRITERQARDADTAAPVAEKAAAR